MVTIVPCSVMRKKCGGTSSDTKFLKRRLKNRIPFFTSLFVNLWHSTWKLKWESIAMNIAVNDLGFSGSVEVDFMVKTVMKRNF